GALRPCRLVAKQPNERRLGYQLLGQRGQDEPAVVTHVDLAVDLEDRSVGREQGGLVLRAVALVEPHLAADVLLHQLLARQEIVFVVLLEDLEPERVGQRLEVHGRGIDQRGHVHELHLALTRRQPRLAQVLHQAEVTVVDRHHDLALIIARHADGRRGGGLPGGERRDQDRGDQGRFHDVVPPGLPDFGCCRVRPERSTKVPARCPEKAQLVMRTTTRIVAGSVDGSLLGCQRPSCARPRFSSAYAWRGTAISMIGPSDVSHRRVWAAPSRETSSARLRRASSRSLTASWPDTSGGANADVALGGALAGR